jgi:hypothetical protein
MVRCGEAWCGFSRSFFHNHEARSGEVGSGSVGPGMVWRGMVWRIFHGHKSVTPNQDGAWQGVVRSGIVR